MIKTIIVDDEQLALNLAEQIIGQHKHIEVVGTFTSPTRCIEAVKQKAPQIAFLDINMRQISGLELAERLLEISPNMYIVFLTAYDTFAVDAFELDVLDYILKPLSVDRLQKTIDRYMKSLADTSVEAEADTFLKVKMDTHLLFEVEPGKFQTISWRTHKAQELFIYLLQNHGQYVEKETLMELLWSDKDLEKSASLLYTNIYNVRKALQQFGDHFHLKNLSDGYVLEVYNVKVDMLDWEKVALALPIIMENNVLQYEAVIHGFPGDYLQKHDYVWLEQRRQSLLKRWQQCIDMTIQFYSNQSAWTKAIHLLEAVCEKYPSDEELHFSLMKIYAQSDDLDAIALQYRKLMRALRAELDISPSTEVQTWYRENVIKKLTLEIKE